jgi:pimeloyl-ACP methyl ester carboxylesterase
MSALRARLGVWRDRRARWILVALYLLMIVLSHVLAPAPRPPQPAEGEGRVSLPIEAQADGGALPDERATLSLLRWPAPPGAPQRLPLVCLHGSPGSATNFKRLAPRIAAAREVWALDLPGFGESRGAPGGYSILAHARALLAALDALGIERAHVLGWSLGGGVALHAADLAPERIASIALVASVGVQETEGSGSYAFEHAKYLAWLAAMEAVDHLVPHFGALGPVLREGRASALNFWASDQRPLRAVLERLERPALIVHGRGDVLAPLAAAERSHELARGSRLAVLDAGHFLPILQVTELALELEPFLARHDGEPEPEPRMRVDTSRPRGWSALDPDVLAWGLAVPWWLQFAALAVATALAPKWTAVVAGAAVAAAQLDFGLAALALALGACAGALCQRGWRLKSPVSAPFKAWGWMLLVLTLSAALAAVLSALSLRAPRLAAPLLALAGFAAWAAWRRSRTRDAALALPAAP